MVDLRDIFKYKLAGARGISDDFIALETDTSIKLLSGRIIKLEDYNGSKGLFEDTYFTKIDFHHTNTSNISNMCNMFWGCHTTSLDLSSFNTSNVKTMEGMFAHCHATFLDLSSFYTSNVRNMDDIFRNYRGTIKSIDDKILIAYNSRRLY